MVQYPGSAKRGWSGLDGDREVMRREISGQSRKIRELLIENKRLRLMLRDMKRDLSTMSKETAWLYERIWKGETMESIVGRLNV